MKNKQTAIANCLNAVRALVIGRQGTEVPGAAAICASQFRRLHDTRGLGKGLPEQLAKAAGRSCDPAANPSLGHTAADVLGPGSVLAQPLHAAGIAAWCASFGGSGAFTAVADWLECVTRAADCAVASAIAAQYPRALEWLALVKPPMQALTPPAADPSRIADAVAALTDVAAVLDGPDGDGRPDVQCGTSCGDGVRNGSESCDGTDLGGAGCTNFGFGGGPLVCTPDCRFDFNGCTAPPLCTNARLPATGQTTCWDANGTVISCPGTGHDGDTRAGAPLAYRDNGDGTITDLNTGLMWEKKSNDPSVHQVSRGYTWGEALTVFLPQLNARCANGVTACADDAGCTGIGSGRCGFAGYRDWRLPNIKELQSIVHYGVNGPAVAPAFNTGCVSFCTVTTCSCTAAFYWSSTQYRPDPRATWVQDFQGRLAAAVYLSWGFRLSVRAVRNAP